MRSKWTMHNGKKILFCDYTNMNVEELSAEVNEVDELFLQQSKNSVLCLSDLSGTRGSPDILDIFKKSTTTTRPYIIKSAVIGIGYTGARKILFDLVMRFSGTGDFTKLFENAETAKAWLIE